MSDGIDTWRCSKEGIKRQIERVVGYTNVFGLCIGDKTEPSANSSDTVASSSSSDFSDEATNKYNRTENMNIVFNTSEAKSQPNVIYVSLINTISN